jgi:hypothetical protein
MNSPWLVTLQDGLDRILDIVPKDDFVFVINGESLTLRVAEVVLVSPTIHKKLQSVPGDFTFNLEDTSLTVKDFPAFFRFCSPSSFGGIFRGRTIFVYFDL